MESLLSDESPLFHIAAIDDADSLYEIISKAKEDGLLKATIDYVHSIDEKSPLQVACETGSVAVVDTLLDAGASLIISGMCKTDAFMAALQQDYTDICELIINKCGNDFIQRNATSQNENFYLHCACLHGNVDAVVLLLHNGAEESLNRRDKAVQNCTPMEIACSRGYLSIVRLLLAAGVNPSLDHSLRCACKCGDARVVKFFLLHDDLSKCFGDVFDVSSSYVFIAACEELGFPVHLCGLWRYDLKQLSEFQVMFDSIALLGHEEFDTDIVNDFRICLHNGVDLYRMQISLVPFTRLLLFESIEVLFALLSYEVMTHDLINTFFVTACMMKRYDDAEMFLQSSLFQVAFEHRSKELCQVISNEGEDRTIDLLIRGGVDVNLIIDKDMGTTLLMFACRCLLGRSATLLIHAGARINCTDINGCNELHYLFNGAKSHFVDGTLDAAETLHRLYNVKQLLISAGVKPDHLDIFGKLPVEYLLGEDLHLTEQQKSEI